MKCTQCGGELPASSKFCPSCGSAMPASRTEMPSEAVMPKKKVGIYAGVAGVVVAALIIALFLTNRGRVMEATPLPEPQQTPVLQAPQPPASPQAGVLETDITKPPLEIEDKTPPPEVVAYLQHLQRVEQTRMALQEREIAALSKMLVQAWAAPLQRMLDMTDPDVPQSELEKPPVDMKEELSDLTRDWQRLSAFFLSVQPPEQCQDLAGKYYDALREVILHVGKIQSYVADQDIGNLMAMRGKSGVIDEKLMTADSELGRVCKEYNIPKTFRIHSDMAHSPVFGF